jgi:succinate dehydrogenase hydrophobic anchor subunit
MKPVKSRYMPLSKRGLNFEMLMWLFTRLTALAMYALILIGITGALIMGARTEMNFTDVMRWGFMPNATHVQNTNVPDLAPWSLPFWKLLGSLLLLVAAAHGVHGLVVILDDYFAQPRVRQAVRVLSIVFLTAMSIIGVYVIWTS